jgi:hypothetical protein
MSRSYLEEFYEPGDYKEVPSEFPRHTSLGVNTDFDVDSYPVVKIRVPVDGIYSVSARVYVSGADPDFVQQFSFCEFTVWTNSEFGDQVDWDRRPLCEEDSENDAPNGLLHVSHAGWPSRAGDLFWTALANRTAWPATAQLQHLSVTYEAALGEVFMKGGGE